KGERVVDALDQYGIACSSGPACASGAANASPVLSAMGLNKKEVWEGVRFSLGRRTSIEDLDEAVNRITSWYFKHSGRVA
ncbi:aminotransferase class V-fold PLP-dependent enzyme, partial [bacterium]|nr:aminotransferase class V-fold PLP-dependent enzyme [bacterium]